MLETTNDFLGFELSFTLKEEKNAKETFVLVLLLSSFKVGCISVSASKCDKQIYRQVKVTYK